MSQHENIQLPDSQSEYKRLREILNQQGYDLDRSRKTFGFTKQQVRLMDIFIVAPFLFWASSKTDNKLAKSGLMFFGLTTFIYNAYNYLDNK